METIAVYWEACVKVYGITAKPGLALGVLHFPMDHMAYWSERIVELGDSLRRFELVTCQGVAADRMRLSLLIEATGRDDLLNLMNGWLGDNRSGQFLMEDQVDLIFLHGPHFQDRFGIADTAFSALTRGNTSVLLSGCAGTSMYLVFAGGAGETALKILHDTFLIPTTF